ncbi:hypothetical protein C4D60_Mb01t30700 [Musa balbisiana]|uniref:Uncharacterized protein n=1 Tax=Musa balbisiana TaxID=52838 RepID=A0A4S8JRX6_MUSBA|nr:hypothetical protein C4D60_Mb01t30700 [Musa balbisiana]
MALANAVEIDDPQKPLEPDRDKQEATVKLMPNGACTLCNKGKQEVLCIYDVIITKVCHTEAYRPVWAVRTGPTDYGTRTVPYRYSATEASC